MSSSSCNNYRSDRWLGYPEAKVPIGTMGRLLEDLMRHDPDFDIDKFDPAANLTD